MIMSTEKPDMLIGTNMQEFKTKHNTRRCDLDMNKCDICGEIKDCEVFGRYLQVTICEECEEEEGRESERIF